MAKKILLWATHTPEGYELGLTAQTLLLPDLRRQVRPGEVATHQKVGDKYYPLRRIKTPEEKAAFDRLVDANWSPSWAHGSD